ncbi:TetR/AcrR family transcriptional regulator [Streptomyces antimicrobicus]|uniref:TetR/AcrR family transcriptional regulator n=1 Tax=Streptomyces antimicrobicus TaxID=2883108 RepID=A0ABS8B344_9ACTN|nr:TetR family transcriptional regulator [Streptomyces antimicrobicus]MCB5179029.1 TetR/AcrR family transcriptional regulator [Streptomyces antimicrobicus]
MPRPSQTLLSRAIIARAALDLLDEQGLEALKMRTIADRLGVKGASLYHHVRSKDDLLDAVAELINDEIDLGPLSDPGGPAGIAAYAHGYRGVYLRYPHMIPLVARHRVSSVKALRGYDALLAALVRAGSTPAAAAEAAAAIDNLVLGSALETFTAGFTRQPADYRPDFPALAAALTAADEAPGALAGLDTRGFDLGLRLILAGLTPSA